MLITLQICQICSYSVENIYLSSQVVEDILQGTEAAPQILLLPSPEASNPRSIEILEDIEVLFDDIYVEVSSNSRLNQTIKEPFSPISPTLLFEYMGYALNTVFCFHR